MTKHLLCLILLITLSKAVEGQQMPNWSSFYEVGFTHNPALTAKWSKAETSITHRSDSRGFVGAPTTTTLSYQLPFVNRFTKTAVGAFAGIDEIGPTKTYYGQFTYNYRIQPNLFGNRNDVLGFGLGAGARVIRFDPSRETAYDGISNDPRLQSAQSSINPDVTIGAFYSSTTDMFEFESHYYGGIALHRFIPTKESFSLFGDVNSAVQVTVNTGYRVVPFRSEYYIEPQLFMTYGWGKTFNAMAACRAEWQNAFWLGTGVGSNGSFFGQIGLIFDNDSALKSIVNEGALRVGLKIDKQVFYLGRYTNIGVELYTAYTFDMDIYK